MNAGHTTDRLAAYLNGAVESAVATIRETGAGGRNEAVNREAYAVGTLLAHGLPRGDVEAVLVAAALAAGLPANEARATVARSLSQGERNPRPLPVSDRRARGRVSLRVKAPPVAVAPPVDATHAAEAADLWGRATRATEDATLTRWLATRRLCSTHAAEEDLIRAMPRGDVPRWAYGWQRDGRALIPVFDYGGRLVSLRGRLLRPAAAGELKTRGAKGVGLRGRVYANPAARRMLAGDGAEVERLWDSALVIAEGDPDWLTLATCWRGELAPAVLGVWSGSLTPETLARVPDGCRVLLCPHRDDSGIGYMRTAAAELLARCEVWAAPYDGPHDYNDTLKLSAIRLAERLRQSKRMGGA